MALAAATNRCVHPIIHETLAGSLNHHEARVQVTCLGALVAKSTGIHYTVLQCSTNCGCLTIQFTKLPALFHEGSLIFEFTDK